MHTHTYPLSSLSLSLSLSLSVSVSVSKVLQKAEEHLLLVTQERSSYRGAVEESKRQARAAFKAPDGSFAPPPLNCNIKPASNAISAHYSFDFAQQVHYPSNPL